MMNILLLIRVNGGQKAAERHIQTIELKCQPKIIYQEKLSF